MVKFTLTGTSSCADNVLRWMLEVYRVARDERGVELVVIDNITATEEKEEDKDG